MSEKDVDIIYDVAAFVCDSLSQKVIKDTTTELGVGSVLCTEGSISDAVKFLIDHRPPKILIIDLSNSELPMTELERIRDVCSPEVNIIAIGGKNDVGLFRSLLKFGVVDYIVTPLNSNLIERAISTLLTGVDAYEAIDNRLGKLITFIGSTGGIGTTTMAVNCAWILANTFFKRTVVIDSDYQFGNGNLLLDLKHDASYLDMLESPDKIDDYFIETILKRHGTRLFYLGGLTDISRPFDTDPDTFAYLIDTVRRQFNYLTVDLKLNISSLNKVLISKTNTFVIIAELSTASAHNTSRLIEYLKQEAREKNVIVILNKIGVYSRGAIAKNVFEKVIGMPVSYIIPFDPHNLYGAANLGQPCVTFDTPINDILHNITSRILGNNITQKVHEIYEDGDILSAAGIKNILNKVGLDQFLGTK